MKHGDIFLPVGSLTILISQSLLRGRFLRNGLPAQDDQERPPSAAERELGQLRQHHRVSGLR